MLFDVIIWLEENALILGGVLALAVLFVFAVRYMRNRKNRPEITAPVIGSVDIAHSSSGVSANFNPAENHSDAVHLIQSVQGDPPVRHFSPFYIIGLAVVTLAMVLLPCVYLAVVSGAGYGVYWHATANYDILKSDAGFRTKLFTYIAPLIIGAIVVLFMLKPLFARKQKSGELLHVTEKEQPVLYAFLQELCLTLRAPFPRNIYVTCDANASAAFQHGLWSIFRRGDVALYLGLPLVAGMSLQSFTGVIAHELGHFSQGIGMRLTLAIRWINSWFAQVVYQRDSWDVAVDEMIESAPLYFGIIFVAAKVVVKLSRGLLWILMWIGHGISCYMLRQQEYDADRAYAYIASSESLAGMFAELIKVSVATDSARGNLMEGLQKMALPEDFVKLCQHKCDQIPDDFMQQIVTDAYAEKSGVFSTHPSYKERTAAALKTGFPGIFHPPNVQASTLFRNIETLCRQATSSYYDGALGRGTYKRMNCPNLQFLEKVEKIRSSGLPVGVE